MYHFVKKINKQMNKMHETKNQLLNATSKFSTTYHNIINVEYENIILFLIFATKKKKTFNIVNK